MSIMVAFLIALEAAAAVFVIWGFLHEERFIAFETRIAKAFGRRPVNKKKASKRLRNDAENSDLTGHDYTAA